MARLEINLDGRSAERLVIAADFAIRDESNDARSQALSLTSIAISLHRIAEALTTTAAPDPVCKRCGLPPNAVIHSGRIESAIGGHEFYSETDTRNEGESSER